MLTVIQAIAASSLMVGTSYLASMSLTLLNKPCDNTYIQFLNGFVLGCSITAYIMITAQVIQRI